jgi:hypothetical protein
MKNVELKLRLRGHDSIFQKLIFSIPLQRTGIFSSPM